MTREPAAAKWQDQNALIFGALAGLSAVGTFELFGRDAHDWVSHTAVCCFAVATPLLTLRFLMIRLEMPTASRWVRRICGLFDLVGLGGAVLGFSGLIASVFWPAAVLFWGTILVALALFWLARKADEQ